MAFAFLGGAEQLLPQGGSSDFDRLLLDGFQRVEEAGLFRSRPSSIQRRCLAGRCGLVAQFSPEHFSKKRRPATAAQQVLVAAADPAGFNFSKADASERIGEVEVAGGEGAVAVAILANISPLAVGHVLLVPRCRQVLPQVMTEEHFLTGLHLLERSSRPDFRMVFNSFLAFASVNHFHWHGLYLGHCGFADARLPIERAERTVVAGGVAEGKVCVQMLSESRWYLRGFALSAGRRSGADGEDQPADLAALASLAQGVVAELLRRNIPHNVVLCPARRPGSKSHTASPEIYILPRQVESSLREDARLNAAAMEMSGLVIAHTEEAYAAFTEESVWDIFQSDVSLPETIFDELICRVAWLAS